MGTFSPEYKHTVQVLIAFAGLRLGKSGVFTACCSARKRPGWRWR